MELRLSQSVVRSWRETDAASIARHGNNRRVWLNLRDAFPHPYTVEDGRRYIAHALSEEPPRSFAIEVQGEAAGSIGFKLHTDVERVSAEIGYFLGEEHWGRGIMTEVVEAVTRHGIAAYGLTRVFAVPFEWNVASFRVLEKAGYRREARMRRSAIKDGRVVDQFLYAWVVEREPA